MSGSFDIDCGFDYVDERHVPTLKISLAPCHADDSAAWEARDLLAKRIKAMLAEPVACRECMGTGGIERMETCKYCKGTGKTKEMNA